MSCLPNSGNTSATSPSSNAKAYGRACQSESKKHVAGQKGTPYSRCVSAAKKLQQQSNDNG